MMIPEIMQNGGEGGILDFQRRSKRSNASRDAGAASPKLYFRSESTAMKIVNLKAGMPLVRDALQQLDRELSLAREKPPC